MSRTVLKVHDLNMVSWDYGDMIHVSFHVLDHEVIGLLGLDGSGIELLCQVLTGNTAVFDGARGSIWLDGREVEHAAELGGAVRCIRMADAILDNWTIAEYLGLSRVRIVVGNRQRKMMQQYAEEKFLELGRVVDAARPIRSESGLNRRIARIIHEVEKGARLLIIEDECLGLKAEEIRIYSDVLRRVSERGVPVLYRSKSLQVSGQICREFLVFRRGRLVKRWKQREKTDYDLLTKYLLGETISAEIRALRHTQRNVRTQKNITYQIKDLRLQGKRFEFIFYEGEVSALVMENTFHCREMFEHISGRKTTISTRYFMGFRELRCRKLKDFIRNRIASTMLGNEKYELFGNMSVEDNLLMPSLQKFSSLLYFLEGKNLHKAIRSLIQEKNGRERAAGISITDESSRIRINMERWLMFRPKVLVLYEPFSTCDTYGATLISTYIKRIANMGTSVIVVKSNEEFMAELADHIYTIK